MLSVIVICKNEADGIEDCLKSITWADEIIVLDSGSTDDTIEICQRYTDQIYRTDWPGFGVQYNRAIEKTSGDWILRVDADERVSSALRTEIEHILNDPASLKAYRMPHLSSFCGRNMKHSGYWPDYVLRLFKKNAGRFSEDPIHEQFQTTEPIGTLKEPLHHLAYTSLEQVTEKMNRYSSMSAKMLYEKGKRGGIMKALLHGCWSFFSSYVLRAGFLDGKEGFLLAVSRAEGSYYKYVKLMKLNQEANHSLPD